MFAHIAVITQAFTFALMNALDAHVVKKHVKSVIGFMPVTGVINIVFGLLMAVFFLHRHIEWIPVISSGILMGVIAMFYYWILQKEDVSRIMGLIYLYPILSLIINWILFHEPISSVNYIGMAICGVAAILFAGRLRAKTESLLLIFGSALLIAIQEAIMSVGAKQSDVYLATSIQTISLGVTLFCIMPFVTRQFVQEIPHAKYAVFSEIITIMSVGLLLYSFSVLPYIFVSYVSVLQIGFLFILERIWSRYNPTIAVDHSRSKLVGTILMIVGVVLVMM